MMDCGGGGGGGGGGESEEKEDHSVRVAVRIRPQLAREIIEACKVCVTRTRNEPQVWLGSNKAFTYDFVYDPECQQAEIYDDTVSRLIEGTFEGYNATVLAYGQTGSGKTYTMGTSFDISISSDTHHGIIPRAVKQLFHGIQDRRASAQDSGVSPPEFKVTTQFMELYNEDIIDLFDINLKTNKKSSIKIHEDANGNIYTMGVTSKVVRSEEETMAALKAGAFNRTTASTNMNDQSSRSHAIFTIQIHQERQASSKDVNQNEDPTNDNHNSAAEGELEILTAKFHFVDLAGSERLKRTGATGDRAKEGISINCGLLALGNVISALGDTSRKVLHVPYRDSKLTRLLQDSLGGNSRTCMIACVSPSDRDFMETLNTLKYANRARNIKNKIMANQDKTSRTINFLRQEIQNLQLELMEYKQGKRIIGEDGVETTNDMYHENTMLIKESANLRTRIKALQETVEVLTAKNASLIAEKEMGLMSVENGEISNDNMERDSGKKDIASMIEKYITEIENLRTKLCESENLCAQLRKEACRAKRLSNPMSNIFDNNSDVQSLIELAKKDLEKNKEQEKVRRISSVTLKDEDADSDDQEDTTTTGNDDDGSTDDDTDTEESENHNEELVELTSEISLKQKLIEELETSQKRLQIMKQQYENKLLTLHNRICATEEERDKVLKNMSSGGSSKAAGPNADKIIKIKEEYKTKLEKLQGEVKKLQAAKKEHAKLLRNQSQYERQVEKLKSDVVEMKRSKVKLVQKMKEESSRHRELENRRNRELSQMKKTSRKNESRIRTLESEKRMKDVVLKRKTEEVNSLRRNARRISQMHAAVSKRRNKFSIKMAKNKWQNIEKQIMKVALNRQAVSRLENDMERWLKEREKLSHKLDKMSMKRKRLAKEKGEESTLVEDLDDQIENMRANLNYLHENIVECQQTIVQMEQAEDPEDEDEGGVTKVVNIQELQLEEARYLMEKLLSMTINQCCLATQKEGAVREIENRMSQAMKQNSLHQQLLQHMIEQQDLEVYDLMLLNEQGDSETDSDSDSTIFIHNNENSSQQSPLTNNLASEFTSEDNGSDSSMGRREKARRKMTTKEDLLFNDTDVPPSPKVETVNNSSINFSRSLSFTKGSGPNSELMSRSRSFVKTDNKNRYNVMSTSMDQSAFSRLAPVYQPSPVLGRRSLERQQHQRRASPKSIRKFNSALKLNDQESPPGSPPSYRRVHRDSDPSIGGGRNVFNRLLAGTSIGQSSKPPEKGSIIPFQGRIGPKSPLICSNVAEGHSKAVLSVYATDEYLFSGSKDRTVKVWDLCRKEEIQSLSGHPNNVVCVKYSKPTRLAFSVSSAFIKVWDLRMSSAICIKTLSSSGLTSNGPVQINSANRTLAMPPGETGINDIALGENGYDLYSAAADKVRMWDLRKFHSIGKLSGGHQAAIMCLATKMNFVATGSKDHYIKVFDVSDNKNGVISPCMNLMPPHYDGIQCLAMSEDSLFSASRDFCIKKWDLGSQEIVKSINNAHKDWICGLAFLPDFPIVVSGCRAGILKLWSSDNCSLIGEMKAHNSTINTITTNSNHVFTGSNDGSIGLWRIRNNYDRSPDSESS